MPFRRSFDTEPLPDSPAAVVVFVPGSMQAAFDQSISLFSCQLGEALKTIGGDKYWCGPVERIKFISSGITEVCEVGGASDSSKSVVVVRADYTPYLSAAMQESRIFSRLGRLVVFVFRLMPLLYRALAAGPSTDHARLSPPQKGFLAIAYLTMLLATGAGVMAAIAILGGVPAALIEGLPEWIHPKWLDTLVYWLAVLVALLVACLPAQAIPSAIAIGHEYYGLLRYIILNEKSREIHSYLDQVLQYVEWRYRGVPIHLVNFSFGCVICFDHLFLRGAPRAEPTRLASLTFIGFPCAMIDLGWSSYFDGRRWPDGQIGRWSNLYLRNDVLGSSIQGYLPRMFGSAAANVPLTEAEVAPQRRPARSPNPLHEHLSYWDPGLAEPCEAIRKVAETVLAIDAGAGNCRATQPARRS